MFPFDPYHILSILDLLIRRAIPLQLWLIRLWLGNWRLKMMFILLMSSGRSLHGIWRSTCRKGLLVWWSWSSSLMNFWAYDSRSEVINFFERELDFEWSSFSATVAVAAALKWENLMNWMQQSIVLEQKELLEASGFREKRLKTSNQKQHQLVSALSLLTQFTRKSTVNIAVLFTRLASSKCYTLA